MQEGKKKKTCRNLHLYRRRLIYLCRERQQFSTQISKQMQKIFKLTALCKFSHNHRTFNQVARCTLFPPSIKLHLNSDYLVNQIKMQINELFSE